MLSKLRRQKKPLAAGLVSLLLASWVAVFCGACLAGMSLDAAPDTAAIPCHDGQPEPHDCCDHKPDCLDATLPDAIGDEAWSLLPQTPDGKAMPGPVPRAVQPAGAFTRLTPFVTGPPDAPDTPAYLRFCAFLN
jgi:hypothetical protein